MDYVGIIKERKVIDGKLYPKYFIDSKGKETGIPTGITLIKGKIVSYVSVFPNKKLYPDSFRVQIPYTDRVTQEQAIAKAIKTISALSKGTNKTCHSTRLRSKRVALDPAFNIDLSEVPNGVSAYSFLSKGAICLKITVTCFDPIKNKFVPKGLYVGTLNNWKERYPEKLQKAIALREESLKLYNKLTSQNENAETTAA